MGTLINTRRVIFSVTLYEWIIKIISEIIMINKKLILIPLIVVALPTLALEPRPAPNPKIGLDGAATMHSDTYSSDTTPLAGPLGADSHRVKSKSISLAAACPTRAAAPW